MTGINPEALPRALTALIASSEKMSASLRELREEAEKFRVALERLKSHFAQHDEEGIKPGVIDESRRLCLHTRQNIPPEGVCVCILPRGHVNLHATLVPPKFSLLMWTDEEGVPYDETA